MTLSNWIKKLFRSKRKDNVFDIVIERFERFRPESQANSFSSDMTLVKILVAYPTIDEYIKQLKTLLSIFELDEIVPKTYAGISATVVLKRDFYTKNGSYVDPVETSKEFVELALNVVRLYRDKMNETNPSFNTSKNLMYLQKLVSNISTLSQELSM